MPIGLAMIDSELVSVLKLIPELVSMLTLIADKLYLDRYGFGIPLWSRAFITIWQKSVVGPYITPGKVSMDGQH